MASKPKKRMKYPPRCARTDTIEMVKEGLSPLHTAENGQWIVQVRLRNHSAVTEFVQGRGTTGSAEYIVHMYNMTRGLVLIGYGVEHTSVVLEAANVIQAIVERKKNKDTFILYASEILTLNKLLELHDAQLDAATIKDLELAYKRVTNEFRGGKDLKLSLKKS